MTKYVILKALPFALSGEIEHTMSAILIISIALRLAATGWALTLLARIRDWRVGFLAAMLTLMAVRQILTLSGQPLELPVSFSGSWDELPGLGVSVLAFLSLFFIGELIREDRARAESLSELSGTRKVILDNAQIGIVLIKDRRIIWANPHFTTMLGWEPKDYRGENIDFLRADDAAHPDTAALGAPHEGEVIDCELALTSKDGSLIWTRLIGRAVNSSDRSLGTIWLFEDISERKKRAEERAALTDRLELTVSRLKHSQDIARLASWEFEPATETVWWSDEAYQMLGFIPGEFDLTLEFTTAIAHPDDRATIEDGFRKAIEEGISYEAVRRITDARGNELVVHEYGEPVFDANGKVVRICGVTQDITEFSRAETALRKNEAHLRGLLANSTAAIASADLNGNFTYWNKAFEELTGYSGEELKTMTNQGISHPDDLEDARAKFDELKRGEADQFRREKRYLRKDGTMVWGDLSASAIRDPDGKLVEVVGVVADITEKKRAEKALRASEAQLKYSQKIAGLASWRYDPRTDTHLWSDGIYSTLGLEPSEIDLNMTTVLALSHPDDRNAVTEALDSVLNGDADVFSVVHRVTRADGTELVVHDHGVPIRDQNGVLIGIDGVTQNITDLSYAETALREREALLSMVLEHSFDGILTLKPIRDPHGQILDFEYTSASQSTIKYFGMDLNGRRVLETFPTSPEDGLFHRYVDALETGQTIHAERHYAGMLPGDPWFRVVTTPTGDGLTVAFNDITEKKRAEEALKRSEARHRSILANSAVAIASNDVDGNFLYWNDAFERFIGYSADELSGMNLTEITHPDESSRASEDFDKMKAGAVNGFRREKKYRRRDAAPVWGDVSVAVIRDPEGNLLQTVAVVADITEKKQVRQALLDREALLSSVLERSFDGMLTLETIYDQEGRVVDFKYADSNGAATQIMGRSVSGKRLLEVFPNARETGQFARYLKVVESGKAINEETRFKDILPGDPWLQMVMVPIEKGVAVAFNDVTEIKNAEKILRDQAAIMDQIHESIVTIDLEGNITGWNKGAEKLFGCPRDEALGSHYSRFFAERDLKLLKAQVEATTFDRGRNEIEIELRRKSGEIFVGHTLLSILLDDQGNATGMVGYTIDVTERKVAEEALKTAYAEMEARVETRTSDLKTELIRGQRIQKELEKAKVSAEQASRAKSEFLSRVSHELRTPMNAILGFGQLLQHDEKFPLTGDQPQYVNEIMSAGDHLMMLISQLLDMSKIETGNLELSLSDLAPGALIEECVAMTLAQAETRGIDIQNGAANLDLPTIHADPLRFKQVLLNLLSNAVKYNRRKGKILIGCAEGQDGTLVLSVTDQGQGITPDKHDSIFEPFNRAGAENIDVPGTGIGLAIAKQMIELMGGEIGIESTPGEGSQFWFSIPLALHTLDTLSIE